MKSFKIPPFFCDLLLSTFIVFSILGVSLLIIDLRPIQLGGGNYYFIVITQSMEPTFNVGDFIICRKTTFLEILVGDIVAVKHPTKNIIIVHRVIEKENGYLRTKGDSGCDMPDNFVTFPQGVLAKYTGWKIPTLGYLIFFSRTFPGLVLIYYIPCSIVLLIQVRKLWISRRGERHQEFAPLKRGECLEA